MIATLNAALRELKVVEKEASVLLQSVEPFGGLKNFYDKPNCLMAIQTLLTAFLGIIMWRTHPITRLCAVCEVTFDRCVFGAAATKTVLDELYKTHITKMHWKTFSAWKILEAIDLSIGGCLNYNGVEVLRSVEGLARYERGILPSRATIQQCAYELHSVGQDLIPFQRKQCDLGECFEYDYEKFIRFLLKSFHLEEISQQDSVEICITYDGAELSDGLSHLTAGVKVTDYRGIDPRNGMPLSSDGLLGRIFKVQSCNYCFPMKSLLGKDCKLAYREFSDFFLFFEHLKKYGLPRTELGPAIKPLNVWSPQDLRGIWKTLNTGSGARKNGNKHFCYLCSCTGNTISSFRVDANR